VAQTIKTIGVVLKSNKHTIEASRLLEIFSPELGKIRAVIRGVEKPKAKLASASQPFCFGEFMLAEKNGFYTVTDCYIQDSFYQLAYNLDKYVLASSMLEATSKLVQENEKNLSLFTLLLNCLKVLVYENAEPTAVAIKYFIKCLNLSGVGFELEHCQKCGKELLKESRIGLVYEDIGALCLEHCVGNNFLMLTTTEWGILKNIYNNEVDKLAKMLFSSRESLTEVLKLVLKQFYYRTNERLISLEKYF